MPRDVVGQPRQRHGLGDVAAADDEEQGKVLDTDRDACLAEQDDVADAGDGHTGHAEGVAVADAVGEVGSEDAEDCERVRPQWHNRQRMAARRPEGAGTIRVHTCCYDEYWDASDLSVCGLVA